MKLRVSLVPLGSSQAVRFLKEEVSGAAWAREQLPAEEGLGHVQASLWEEERPLCGPPGSSLTPSQSRRAIRRRSQGAWMP